MGAKVTKRQRHHRSSLVAQIRAFLRGIGLGNDGAFLDPGERPPRSPETARTVRFRQVRLKVPDPRKLRGDGMRSQAHFTTSGRVIVDRLSSHFL